jgi:O-antigen/teichoic acid export membrane protein
MVASPFAVVYFKEPRVSAVMWVLAGCVMFAGSGNIGMTLARKQLIFSLEFKQQIICKVVSAILTILASLYFKDYRGLLVGVASGYIMGWITSYMMHPYRPRWCWEKVAEIWGFTKWLLLSGIAGFFLHKVDQFIAARVGNTQQYGLYNVGADLGQLPTGELGPAMLRAFLPVLSSIQEDAVRVKKAVLKTISAANTITMPVGIGFAAVAVPATYLMLGEKWIDAVPYVAGFALISTVQFCMSPLGTLLVMRGHARVMNSIGWGEFATFILFCLIFIPHFQIVGLIFARLSSSVCGLLFGVMAARRYCELPVLETFGSVARPFIGSVGMGLIVWKFETYMPKTIIGLAACVFLGMISYLTWILSTWYAAGRPEGLESTIFDYLKNRLNSSR